MKGLGKNLTVGFFLACAEILIHSLASKVCVRPYIKALISYPRKNLSSLNLSEKDEFIDEATYTKKWRERRMKELLKESDLSPSQVNDFLEPNYLERQRYILAPDEAFGAIFQLDVLTDIAAGLLQPLWAQVAKEYNLKAPTSLQCQRALGMLPEKAIIREFHWTQNFAKARKISLTFALITQDRAMFPDYSPQLKSGVFEWLKKLKTAGVPCCAISRLPRGTMNAVIENAKLSEFLDAQVSADDDFERDLQGFLKSSLKILRPPGKCVVFDCRPQGIMQAHEAEFKAVAVTGVYPLYELKAADVAVKSMSDLRILNMRRLFNGPVNSSLEPQLQTQLETEKKRKPVASKYRDDPQQDEKSDESFAIEN